MNKIYQKHPAGNGFVLLGIWFPNPNIDEDGFWSREIISRKRRILYGWEKGKFWITIIGKYFDANYNVFKENGWELYVNQKKIL